MKSLNRSAVVVKPGLPFLHWLREVDPNSVTLTLDDLAQDPSVYLIDEGDSEDRTEAALRTASLDILVEQFAGWYNDAATWPTPLDYKLLCQWFEFRIHSMVFDAGSTRPLRRSDR